MPWLQPIGPSLIDTAGKWPVDWWLVYSDMDDQTHWQSRVFRRGFQHVKAVRRDGRIWVGVFSTFSFVDVQVIRSDETPWQMFPGATIQHVVSMRRAEYAMGKFHVGPLTCVDVVKSLLGIRSWWVRTPWQLYQHCRRVYGRQGHERLQAAG